MLLVFFDIKVAEFNEGKTQIPIVESGLRTIWLLLLEFEIKLMYAETPLK